MNHFGKRNLGTNIDVVWSAAGNMKKKVLNVTECRTIRPKELQG